MARDQWKRKRLLLHQRSLDRSAKLVRWELDSYLSAYSEVTEFIAAHHQANEDILSDLRKRWTQPTRAALRHVTLSHLIDVSNLLLPASTSRKSAKLGR